jgi:hypothetical protein
LDGPAGRTAENAYDAGEFRAPCTSPWEAFKTPGKASISLGTPGRSSAQPAG